MSNGTQKLREEYFALLEKNAKEQVYQKFIENHTQLVPREFVQNHGVACQIVLRKLPFGADYKSDFFFLSKSSDDWNAVFIEIEKPSSLFFKDGTNEFHRDFVHALQQIGQWRAWLDDNQAALLNMVNTLRVPETMRRNKTYNKFVLVYGRRAEYGTNDIRRGLIRAQERPDFKIMTFDSLAEDLEHKDELMLGIRRNEYIDLINEVCDDIAFRWLEPTEIRVTEAHREKIRSLTPAFANKNTSFADRVLIRKELGEIEPAK